MLHGFLLRDHFKNKMKPRQNWAISNTLNESSKTIMRPYKKNATRKLIVKGHEARLSLSKVDGMHTEWLNEWPVSIKKPVVMC